jgi:hypothetical protein
LDSFIAATLPADSSARPDCGRSAITRARDPLLHVAHGERRTHDQQERRGDEERDGRGVALEIVGKLSAECRPERGGRADQEQCVAVRRRRGDAPVRARRAGAGPVLDDRRLPEILRKLASDRARGAVRDTA